MSSTEDKKPDYEFSIGGYKLKYSNKLMMIIIAVAPVVGGTLWGAFTWYADDVAFKKKVNNYVAPDLSAIETRLATLEESTNKVNDYTRDIKNDLKKEIREIDVEVKTIRNDSRAMQKEARDDVKEIRKEVDIKIRRALENPLANNKE